MHARYYNPNIARFLSVDPGRDVDPKVPQAWNLYGYVRNNPTNVTDPTGKWVVADDVVFTIGGALIGLAGQGLSDLISGQSSGRENYISAAIGGAAAGEALLYTGPLGAGAIGGAVTNVSRQVLKNWTGRQEGFDAKGLVVETSVGAAAGLIPGAKVPGVNVGRGSFSQVFKQIVTKAQSGTISTVSAHTAAKMFAGRVVDTAALEATLAAAALSGSGVLSQQSSEKRKVLLVNLTGETAFHLFPSH